jgi:hypothetical protein
LSIVYFITGLLLASCSQTATGIYKTYSFYKVNTPGNIPVDENGRPIGKIHDTVHVVYFETAKKTKPHLTGFIIRGNYYKPILTRIDNNSEEAGTLLQTNKPIIVKGKVNNQLWKVEAGEKIDRPSDSKFKDDLIYLVVIYEGRNTLRIIKKHKELVPELHY